MEGTMKYWKFVTKGQVEVDEMPIPDYGPNGVLVKVARAGICGSDIHAFTKGGMYGGVGDGQKFGHEYCGTIVEVGENVKDLYVGQRVWVDNTDSRPEGPRYACMCGAFAEYCGNYNAKLNETVFPLPDNVPFSKAVLIEPFSVGVHTKNRGGAKPGQKIMMIGAGPIGLMGWTAMKHQGIEDIIVMEQSSTRIEFAKRLGANIFDNTDKDSYEIAAEQFGTSDIYSYERADIDLVVDYVGLGVLLGEFLEKGRGKSTFATLSLDGRPLEIKPNELMSKQFTIVGSRAYDPSDNLEVIDVLANCPIEIESIITGEFTLDQPMEAFEAACDKEHGYKVVINIAD